MLRVDRFERRGEGEIGAEGSGWLSCDDFPQMSMAWECPCGRVQLTDSFRAGVLTQVIFLMIPR